MPLFVAFIAILLVAAFVFGIDRVSGGLVRDYAQEGGGVIWSAAASAVSIVTENGGLATRRALEEENTELKDALAMRDEQAARFRAVALENESLREMANLASMEDGITVPVLSSFSSSPYGTFRIGGGAAAGLSEGNIVLTPGGFVLGSITSVSSRGATVEAFFAPEKEIEMQVAGVPFLAEGRGGGNARGEIARDASVRVGDVVTVPAFGGRPSGVIGMLESASSSAYTSIYIRIPRNLDSMRYVHVLSL
ncbi:MAG: rod shape-determining protein MreC [Minisyncoccia bacterium]